MKIVGGAAVTWQVRSAPPVACLRGSALPEHWRLSPSLQPRLCDWTRTPDWWWSLWGQCHARWNPNKNKFLMSNHNKDLLPQFIYNFKPKNFGKVQIFFFPIRQNIFILTSSSIKSSGLAWCFSAFCCRDDTKVDGVQPKFTIRQWNISNVVSRNITK